MSEPKSTAAEATATAQMPGWQIAAAIATAVYFVVFYLADAMRAVRSRLLLERMLLVPELYFNEWVGGDPARFGMADRLPVLAAATAMVVVATLAGGLCLVLLRVERCVSRLEAYLLAVGIGLNLLSSAMLALGLAGGLQRRWPVIVFAGLIALAAGFRRQDLQRLFCERRDTEEAAAANVSVDQRQAPNWLHRLGIGLAVPFAVALLLGSFLPPWHFDVREYHAQVPKEWHQSGRIGFLPHNFYGNMPLGAETHQLLGMQIMSGVDAWWWGTLVGKLIIGLFAILAALTVYALGRRYDSPAAGAVGGYIFISTPWVAHVSMAGLIDGASAFYLVLTLFALLRWLETRPRQSYGFAAVAGFLAGAAVACKYPALLFVVIPGGLLMVTTMVLRRQFDGRTLFIYALAAACGCGLWLGKNWVLTGNPTYPLLYDLFGGETWTAAKDAQWSHAHRPPAGGFTLQSLMAGVKLLAVSSEFMSPLLIPFAVLGLASRRHRRVTWLSVGTIVFVVVAWWSLTHRVDRFLVPLLPVVALLGGCGAALSETVFWRRSVIVLLLAALLPNLSLNLSRVIGDNRFLVSLRDLQRLRLEDSSEHNPHLHLSLEFLNEEVRPGFRALMCGEAQVFDLEMPILYNTCFDDCVFERLLKGKTREQRYETLRQQRISHVHIKWHELDRYRSPGNYGYSDFTTRALVRQELVAEQQLLREIPLGLNPDNVQIFEVVGWRTWTD